MGNIIWEDIQLLKKLDKGGRHRQEAISTLYREYSGKFEWYFVKHRVSQEIAQDIVQDTFVNIVKGYSSFRKESDFSAWLWAVARNTMLGHFRKQSKHVNNINESEEVDMVSSENTNEYESLEDCVQQAINNFSDSDPDRAKALILASIEGWTTNELATFLDRTVGATREYISQCRKKVKSFMAECEDYLFTSDT